MFSCKSNHICPSFESAYILDREIRDQTFSLFDADTLPKEDFIVRKDKNGIIKSVKYRKKRDAMLTVKMETIYPQVEPLDTMLLAEQDLTPEEMEQILSEGERPVNHYNVDQIYYMRHFGQYLPMPEEPGARGPDGEELEEIPLEEPVKKKRKKWQFWKKKEVEPVDSLSTGFEEEESPFEQFEEDKPDEKLNKKEQRRLEQEEKREQEELEKAKEPVIIDLEDFQRDRDQATPAQDDSGNKSKKAKKPKGEKKIKLGFGKKKKKTTDSVELIEEEEEEQ